MTFLTYKDVPGLRAAPDTPDDLDGKRVEYVQGLWHMQDAAYRSRDRQVEENIRMLVGLQWSIYNPLLGKWLDMTQYMSDEERRWRQRPVFNRILPWFILTHARLVENPPIVTFEPGPDAIDATLAETLDIVFKAKWRDLGMVDVVDRLMGWLIPAGTAYLQTRVDLQKGPLNPWVGYHEFDTGLVDEYGQPIMHGVEGVPFDQNGQPRAQYTPDGIITTGEPHVTREGDLVVDVLSPLEVRGQWGPQPWHEKKFHMVKSFLTAEEVYEQYGMDVTPDTLGENTEGAGELNRLLFGSGYFGAASARAGSDQSVTKAHEGYVEVTTLWRAPCNYGGMEETLSSPGGRLLVVTKQQVLYDGVRPARFRYTSPVRRFDFVRIPGRPQGTTPQEAMNGPQRAYNRGWAQILEHRNLVTNPKGLIDAGSGLGKVTITNQPGENYVVNRRANVPPFEWVAPPSLGGDVYQTQEMLLKELTDLGQQKGTEGEVPTDDASGELIKELRFNSDRFIGPTVRRAVEEFARMVEDWRELLPTIWDREKVISYAGEDNVAKTITVLPELFKTGTVNVVPDVESMLPEGRGERQAKVYKMYLDGVFGLPGSPPAVKMLLELARFPHLSRTAKPGGVQRRMAEQFNGRLVQGEPAEALPIFPWYDELVHLDVLTDFMASPEFLKQPMLVQQNFQKRWTAFQQIAMQKAMEAQAQQVQQQAQMAQAGAAGRSKADGDGDEPPKMVDSADQHQPSGGVPGGSYPTALGAGA